uniref:(E2-independent) E3 ubiquitin-conjugating enzyme FATS isoform X3 n=1 Tax=Jaculus jaculus TaxID=51337 RepID=UPI001E1B42C6|nr:(E2-independent) E3 ubiquitin-conjugating enzyme FATS isoform X3 [Jaculus jaculus]
MKQRKLCLPGWRAEVTRFSLMQHSGMPVKAPREARVTGRAGQAPRCTFHITTFRTELKNHVMVMDLVQSNWFPSQRRAQVCVVHMCPGLKTSEQPASRYEETLASQNTNMISSLVISQLMDEKKSKENGALSRAIAQPRLCPTKPALANHSAVSIHRSFALPPDRLGIPSPDERGLGTVLPAKEDSLGRGPSRGFASITITARRVGPPTSALVWGTAGDPGCLKCRSKDAVLQVPPTLASGFHARHQYSGPGACAGFPRNGSVVRLKVPQCPTRLRAGHEYWVTHLDNKEDVVSSNSPPSRKSPLVFSSCVHLRVSRQCPSAIYYLDKSLWVPLEQPRIASPEVHRSVLSLNLRCSSHRLTADGVGSIANGEPMSGELKQETREGKQDLQGLPHSHWKENPALERVHLEHGTCPWIGSPPLESVEFADAGSNQVMVREEREDHATGQASSHASQLSIHIPGWSYRAVETKVFSGSSKEQQGEAHVRLLASSVEQTPIKHFSPDGDSSPSNDCQSSNLSEPSERRHPRLLRPRVTLPGFLCPLRDSGTSLQEDRAVQIERQFPEGDYTCCDLVVKLEECKKSEDPKMSDPSPVPPAPAPPDGPRTPYLLEDDSEPQPPLGSSMTLKEALEVRKPQFISRSQERLKKLEHMVQQRRAQQESLGQRQSTPPARANRKQFTVPHPLSDNLFKPKERCISEKEMHMRSKRIYNNLPEVKKKKEEQKKRVILQSNRLRAEVFKKQLLDQLLQRNAV